jgi:hypothetical protein
MGIYYKKNFTYKIKKNIHTPQVFKNLDFSSPFFLLQSHNKPEQN